MQFAKRVRQIKVSAIKQMPILAQSVPGAISLGQGIPSLKTPQYIRDGIAELLQNDDQIGKYSLQPGLPELREAAAKAVQNIAGRAVSREQIFISAGAMEALFCAITSIVDEGDEVILFDPSYASHIEQVLYAGGKPVFVALLENQQWALDFSALNQAISSKTKAIIVCNPGNPTGKVFSEEELSKISVIAEKHNLFVIADETYEFLTYEDNTFISLTSFSNIKDQIIACYSFSKKYAMTGWRVGYLYAASEIINECLKVHDASIICAPTISQHAALIALSSSSPEIEDLKLALTKRRALALQRLGQLGDLFTFNRPEGAYYILARYLKTNLSSEAFALKLLREAKVITIPGSAFGPAGDNHIRFTFGGTEQQITEAFNRIEEWNKKLA